MMKKLLSTTFAAFFCFTALAQSVATHTSLTAGNNSQGVAYSIGQSFNQHAPDTFSVPLVAEGLLQGYTVETYDTLLLLTDEMESYTPGNNLLRQNTAEGYDENLNRQVYELSCPLDFDTTMAVSGVPTCYVNLSGLYAATVAPNDSKVVLTVLPANPYNYPVGVTSVATWTATVGSQTKECHQNVVVHSYNCVENHPSVNDIDGHSYPVVNLGNYCWTGRNMRTQHYADGTSVPNVMTFPASYAPEVDDIEETFGHLYTWDAATQYNVSGTQMQGVCPNGWHVPTDGETEYLLSMFGAAELMSNDDQIHWLPTDGTDVYGFSFLPVGCYNAVSGLFEGLYVGSFFWTSETEDSIISHACEFGDACGTFEIVPGDRRNGYSVRCVLDY